MKTWLVTGASRGLGATIARKALDCGDFVVATARNSHDIALEVQGHQHALSLNLDVTDASSCHQVVSAAIERFGHIDVLVNNAGYGLVGAIEESSSDEVERIFATNVFGLLNVTRAVLPFMRQRRTGHVINFSSLGGYAASAGFGIYSSTKFAVEGISEALYQELKPLGIRSTVVEPGYFRTTFLGDKSIVNAEAYLADYAETAGVVRDRVKTVDGNQPGDPEKLALAILKIVNSNNPPMRLPLGQDALQRIEKKHRDVEAEIALWRYLSESTGFD